MTQADTRIEGSRTCVLVKVGKSHYCVPVRDVCEVVTDARVTPVPGAPAAIPGVVNVRGRVMALLDLRLALNGERYESDQAATALVLDPEVAADMAMRVDEVIDVLEIEEAEFQTPPSFGLGRSAACATAVAELPAGLAVVLGVRELLSAVAPEPSGADPATPDPNGAT